MSFKIISLTNSVQSRYLIKFNGSKRSLIVKEMGDVFSIKFSTFPIWLQRMSWTTRTPFVPSLFKIGRMLWVTALAFKELSIDKVSEIKRVTAYRNLKDLRIYCEMPGGLIVSLHFFGKVFCSLKIWMGTDVETIVRHLPDYVEDPIPGELHESIVNTLGDIINELDSLRCLFSDYVGVSYSTWMR